METLHQNHHNPPMEIKITHELSPDLKHFIKGLFMTQSTWLTQTLNLINTISINSAGSAATNAAIAALQTRLTSDEGTEADQAAAITALAQKLAASTPSSGSGTGTTGALPVVSSVSPTTDKLAGGTVITVNGSGFSVSAPTIAVNGVAGTGVSVASDILLTFVSGAQSTAGGYDVLVTTNAGTSVASAADQIAYS